jgi:hypothetical protein
MNALRQQSTKEDRRAAVLRKTVQSMTTAERVQRRFSAGRPTNELKTAQEALWMAHGLKQQLGEALKDEGLSPEDCEIHIAALTPDLSMLLTYRFTEGDAEKMRELHAKITSVCSIPVGLIFGVREHDSKAVKEFGGPHMILGAKPFLNTKLVADALNHRIKSEENLLKGGSPSN